MSLISSAGYPATASLPVLSLMLQPADVASVLAINFLEIGVFRDCRVKPYFRIAASLKGPREKCMTNDRFKNGSYGGHFRIID
jgi:hypothetical protein